MTSMHRVGLCLSLWICGGVADLSAGDSPIALVNNPFSKPAILAAPAKKASKRQAQIAEPLELQLSATLVSDFAPLVIIEGEMLGIGEQIEGYRLLAVEEGRAVFAKQGERHTFVLVGSGVDVE
ncbi:MAG: hypothetical protein QNJ78_08935 [Gammaproteobacteria bacterium]|nr:hypothetical protein [Gammaproteobacteria bacterium]